MKVFTAPEIPNGHLTDKVFLAGSIENGEAPNWQKHVIERLETYAGVIFNPRREAWDASWASRSAPSSAKQQLERQIDWELDQMEQADIVFFFFHGDTMSPVSMLELGLALEQSNCIGGIEVIVVCPPEFWRATNVFRTCRRYNVPVYAELEDGITALKYVLNRGF